MESNKVSRFPLWVFIGNSGCLLSYRGFVVHRHLKYPLLPVQPLMYMFFFSAHSVQPLIYIRNVDEDSRPVIHVQTAIKPMQHVLYILFQRRVEEEERASFLKAPSHMNFVNGACRLILPCRIYGRFQLMLTEANTHSRE